MMTVPADGLALLFYANPPLVAAGVVAGTLFGLFLLYQLLGLGPRRQRACRRVERLLRAGDWKAALALAHRLCARSRAGTPWQEQIRRLQAECLQAGIQDTVQALRYEDALRLADEAAAALGVEPLQAHRQVIDAALAEARRLFAAANSPEQTAATHTLLANILLLQSPCAEASFWQGLCYIREGKLDQAAAALRTAEETARGQFVDPLLYLGGTALRDGRAPEAVRWLAEANRLDPSCPFVTLQLGQAIVAAKGDSNLAVVALQRALTRLVPLRGDAALLRAWTEFLPEGKSFVRRLATNHSFVCPLLGGNVTVIVRRGQLALAEAEYRRGRYQAAADLFEKLLQDCPPTAALLRGLGLSLARLERYDEAFKHLRIAYEQEEPKQPLTAGYLALCGALGKPKQEEDRPKNVAWAIQLLARFQLVGDADLARISSRLLTEARALRLPVSVDQRIHLCQALVSAYATEPQDAEAYDDLAANAPEAVQSAHAYLYCRAAAQHGFRGRADLDLFARAFHDWSGMQEFFTARQWSFEDAEFAYLQRWAEQRPGTFPELPVAEYPRRAADLLLERSRKQAETGDRNAARQAAEVLLRLQPNHLRAHDWLSQLSYQQGDLGRAADLLTALQQLDPQNPIPSVRRAVIEQKRGQWTDCAACVQAALERAAEKDRGAVALLGARLLLTSIAGDHLSESRLEQAKRLLEVRLRHEPDDVTALSLLTAVFASLGDRARLAALAPAMDRPGVNDLSFQFFAGLCFLAGGNYDRCLDATSRLLRDPRFAAEGQFLAAWANYLKGDRAAAVTALRTVADATDSPSSQLANAWLGGLECAAGNDAGAIEHWLRLTAEGRIVAGVEAALRSSILVAGLSAYDRGGYEEAASCFRKAMALDSENRELRDLLAQALEQAARRFLSSGVTPEAPTLMSGRNGTAPHSVETRQTRQAVS
jgi:tetratricopeptide (TPR) repeat protein